MGWKASCIFVNQREIGYLGTFPQHDPELARNLVGALPLPRHEPGEMCSFETGMYPNPGQLIVGVYPGAAVIGHDKLCDSCFEGGVPPVVNVLQKHYSNAPVLAITLHSVVNLFGYAYFEGGKLIRARAGSSDDGIFLEVGEWLPEEQKLFAQLTMRDGSRVFPQEINGETEELSEDAMGEEFVFDLSRRFFGCRIDECDAWELKMQEFKPVQSLFRRLFGGKT
jgi:hypothetical protein